MNAAAQPRELYHLLSAVCDHRATVADRARLEELVLASDEACEFYVQYIHLHAAVARYSLVDQPATVLQPERMAPRQWPAMRLFGYAAARVCQSSALLTVLIAAVFYGAFGLLVWQMSPHGPAADRRAWLAESGTELPLGESKEQSTTDRVATLSAAEDCTWQVGGAEVQLRSGTKLRGEESLELISGVAEITFADGAEVVLQGPTRFIVNSAGRAKLERGKLVARVPQRAIGFTVITPAAEVVDLGTEFGVHVDVIGDSDVQVFQGTVDLVLPPSATAGTANRATRRLSAGEAVKVRATTAEFSDSKFAPDQFVRQLPPAKPRYGPPVFIDLKKSATAQQSSEFHPEEVNLFRARHAFDGDFGTFSHTDPSDTSPWWQVDLGSTRTIATVILHNRQKFTAGRLRDITIKILAEDGEQVLFTSPLLNQRNELGAGEKNFNKGPEQIVLELVQSHGKPVEGRYVRVERTVTDISANLGECNVLSLAEVQILEAKQLSKRSQSIPARRPETPEALD